MNEVRDSSSKTVTFLCLGICLFLFVYVIAGKFIKEISPEELAKTGNKSRFKMQAQLVHKNVNEEFQKLFIMNKDVIFSDCNESHKKIIIKTIGEEKVNYYVKINSNTFITEFYVSNDFFKIECKDDNGIKMESLDTDKCKIETLTMDNTIKYNEFCN